ncbi:hypothetical protein MCOR27_003889 [Pyricularia oryzae]|uniref:Major facilitator superfamily (MFS) profile domain-containing protein n=2 Tax=Pyricularia TaxID=48558 RepID=A0ABQ8NMI0_PYRGI|nr:hypothetical protein MCOR02_005905 [Pyricularia oryzae]KAI6299379.1 hypothetical protein MCOR33_004708 [Pyricularia grisea]KAI6252979.1 hypothetical protein MCOR19_010433 [Pyricularia oryzae]KAI6264992.1 hypothetical protein MCOR26_011002 [Pyricularia oryzae]KAI6282123.1 hypothetical protein MCOR27_003889 [Pyricularia oryzae]
MPSETGRESRRGCLGAVADELGVATIYRSPANVKLLIIQRAVRLMAYGASTLPLIPHLRALGHSESLIGLFLSLTLVGDVLLSLLLTAVADRLGRRAILGIGSIMMTASGIVFAISSNYWILLVAAVFGVISPSGNEIGPFRAIEESIVAQLTPAAHRSDVYAWYSLMGTAGAATGIISCGWTVQSLQRNKGWSETKAFQAIFLAYAAFGVIKLALTLCLNSDVEAEVAKILPQAAAASEGERRPLLAGNEAGANGQSQDAPAAEAKAESRWSLLPQIRKEGRLVIVNLCLLFMLDSFASGLVSLSWISYYFKSTYNMELGTLGSVFFTTNVIAAISMLVASSLAKRFGNVNTMVFTHLPSSIFLALIPVPSLQLSLAALFLRHCTASMDAGPRSAFLAAVIRPSERTAVMGLINTLKTIAQSVGPSATGFLAGSGHFWVAFVVAGSLKATYDLGLLAVFKNHEKEELGRMDREAVAGQNP